MTAAQGAHAQASLMTRLKEQKPQRGAFWGIDLEGCLQARTRDGHPRVCECRSAPRPTRRLEITTTCHWKGDSHDRCPPYPRLALPPERDRAGLRARCVHGRCPL